jgi:hypothetical protein
VEKDAVVEDSGTQTAPGAELTIHGRSVT